MSQSTYLHFFAPQPVDMTGVQVNDVLRALRVVGVVHIYRAVQGHFDWDNFMTGVMDWPERDIMGQRVAPEDAGSFFDPTKYLSVDCVRGHPEDRRAQLVSLIHEHFPHELQREFYLNNLVVTAGPHDVFEIVENSNGELFARTNFSVAFWGYRHPENTAVLRSFLGSSELVQTIQTDLAAIVKSEISWRLYLT